MAKVALGNREPLLKRLYEGNGRAPNAIQSGGAEHEVPLATTAVEQQRIRLVAACPTPEVLSCDTNVAHLQWAQPSYLTPPADAALPRLVAHSFQIEWAEVSFRVNDSTPQIAEDAWKPLPSGDVTAAEVKVGGLRPGRSYALRINVTLDLSELDSDAYDITTACSPAQVFKTQATVPSQVKPPLLSARDRKSLRVKWNAPDEPGGEDQQVTYQLFLSPPPQGWAGLCNPQGYVEVYQGPERFCKVVKLIPGARYSFWVLARNSVGFSEPGQVATYTTQATVPAQPEAPRPVSCTQSSITLQWVAPPGNGAAVSNYVVERDEGGTLAAQRAGLVPNNFTLAYAGPMQTVMVGGLRSGLHYRFRLRAENDEGASFWSECCYATPAASPPGVACGVLTSSITQQSATVSWGLPADDGGSPVLAHEVEIQAVSRAAAESMGSEWLKIFEGCITACTISSLQPGCTYRVRVRCANQAGWGSWCLPVDLITAPDVPGAPGAAVIQQAGTTSLTLTWQAPRHNGGQRIIAFLVELLPPSPTAYTGPVLPRVLPGRTNSGPAPPPPPPPGPSPSQSSSGTANTALVYRGEDPVAVVSNLQPGVTYQFRVQACNALGAGPWGEWSMLGTAPDVPSATMPPGLASPPTSSSLRVSWQAPDTRGAPIQSYILQAAVQGQMTSTGKLIPHSQSATNLSDLANGEGSGNGSPEPVQTPIAPEHAGLAAGPWQQVYKGTALQAEMQALQPCTRYLLRVAAANAVGLGSWSPVTALTTAPAPPRAPQGAVAVSTGAGCIRVSWQPPVTDNGSAITRYTVDMQQQGGQASTRPAGAAAGGWQQVATVGAGECHAVVSGLLPGRAYQFRVRAGNACGSSPNCMTPAACTDPAPPGPPQRLTLTHRAATFAKVKWDEPAECNGASVSMYRLEVASLDTPCACALAAPAPQQQQQRQALENGHGASLLENGHAEANGHAEHIPAMQHQQHAVSEDEVVSVDAVVDVVDTQPQGPVWVEVACGQDGAARVPDLQPGCRYLLRVSAMNVAGWGPASVEEPFTTALAPPGPPEGLEACLATGSSATPTEDGSAGHAVQLRWLPPAPCATNALVASYEIHAVPVAPSYGQEFKKVVSKATSHTWDELQPGLRYALRVRAAGMEGAGHGPWSEPVEMVMPGHSRGVTDSADSMSAASGTNETAPLASLGLSAGMSLGKGSDRAARKRVGKKAGRQAAKQQQALYTNEPNEDTVSVTSQAQSVTASRGTPGSAAAAAAVARNRVNTSKLTLVAVQKRPKVSLQLGRELRQLVTAPGQALRRAQRGASKAVYRVWQKYTWHILAMLVCAVLAWALQGVFARYVSGSVDGSSSSYSRSSSNRY